jgi:hypothetical protein
LVLAAKMAEFFRNDVRQARRAECPETDDRIVLNVGETRIEYRLNPAGRIERRSGGQLDFAGPAVLAARFAVQTQTAAHAEFIQARWTCLAEELTEKTARTVLPAGRELILDTALRAGDER